LNANQYMRRLPKVEKLLADPMIHDLMDEFGRYRLVNVIRESIDKVRQDLIISINNGRKVCEGKEELRAKVIELVQHTLSFSCDTFTPVINATGVVLHTNLGRAPLPREALDKVIEVSTAYSNLEYNIRTGERGERYELVREHLCDLTGAQDALVVNNNAAAVLLSLSAMAFDKEVIISRGQLVEIGGSFRIPDIMSQGGAKLVEVGTTNKTYIGDYERAINENTALLLKVHTSNFKIIGFSANVANSELCELGEKYHLPVMEDLGSGILLDLKSYGFPDEPTVGDSIKSGVDIVTFSGDKLLGGPQAGIIVGRSEFIQIIKEHPLARAVRIDKMTLAALEAVLKLYKKQNWKYIPTINMLTKSPEELQEAAAFLAKGLEKSIGQRGKIQVVDDVSQAGGGSYPGHRIPTKAVAITLNSTSTAEISQKLRQAPIPIIGRIKEDRFLFDVRTMSREDINKTIEMVASLL